MILKIIITFFTIISFWILVLWLCKISDKEKWEYDELLYKTNRAIEVRNKLTLEEKIILFVVGFVIVCFII
jgi:hypothetical protein